MGPDRSGSLRSADQACQLGRGGSQRLAQEVALREVATDVLKECELTDRLNALGDRFHP